MNNLNDVKDQPGIRSLLVELRVSIVATLCLAVLLCGLYPLVVWALAQGLFPHEAKGSLVVRNEKTVGSSLLAQAFSGPGYFHPRPSAAGEGYDGARSGGSNLGPTSRKLMDEVGSRAARYRAENGLAADVSVPADAVTASGSGLDPHISLKNALLQAHRVAEARGLPDEAVLKEIEAHTEGRQLGVLGQPRVNVLRLNLALDES
jgi:K+-transporting ATPase ATPase C chain